MSRILLLDTLEIIQKIIPRRLFNKGIKKPRLKFYFGLAIIGLLTTEPSWSTRRPLVFKFYFPQQIFSKETGLNGAIRFSKSTRALFSASPETNTDVKVILLKPK